MNKPYRTAQLLLLTGSILCCCTLALSQKVLQVIDWKAAYSLNSYLVQQMHSQYAARKMALSEAMLSADSLQRYIQSAGERYRALLGDMPPRVSLNASITGRISGQGYTIEKVVYQSVPGRHVTANLYIPAGKGPYPSVLLFCGHEDAGKATPSYQQTALLFVRNGYVVLVVDPLSQSERYQLTDTAGKPLTRGGTTEHTLLNQASNIVGLSTAADELWDNVRSLDYLLTRPEADTSRIGCLGNSGGAMQTIYFAGYDSRIKVMAVCSYLATRDRTMELSGPADGCAQMPGEGMAKLEMADYLLMAAPRPILILAGRYDFIDYTGTEEAYQEIHNAYALMGHAGKTKLFTVDDGHGISQPKREAAVRWFSQWLKGDSSAVKEPLLTLQSSRDLAVTTTGQVVTSFKDETTIMQRNIDRYQSAVSSSAAAGKNGLLGSAHVNVAVRNVITEAKEGITYRGLLFQPKIIRKTGELPLPVLVTYPAGKVDKVWIGSGSAGKSVFASGDSIHSLLESGYAVILADLRGIGETADKPEFNDPKYVNSTYRNAMLSLHIGNTLVGQRATDILSIVDMIKADTVLTGKPVTVAADGETTLPALLAALAEPDISHLVLRGGIRSYADMLNRPTAGDWYAYTVPGLAIKGDIPLIEKMIGAARISWLP